MDEHYLAYQSLEVARDSANWAFWAMVLTGVGSIFSFIALLITGAAGFIAFKTMNSWKEQAKQQQLIRLKRAVFDYRRKIEELIVLSKDEFNLAVNNELQPLLSNIFHELVLAGLDEEECPQAILFGELCVEHNLHRDQASEWTKVFRAAINLQESIKISLK
ncbi:hypothetical protein [Ewingella allii]|uniref:hypothetical protein n=1 Tax=Ewingella allii TaxID=3092550 RepID=UPI003798342B